MGRIPNVGSDCGRMTSYHTDGKVGPWAEKKLDRLTKYLEAYTTILCKRKWCEAYYYVDAFAGGGDAPLRKKDVSKKDAQESLLDIIDPTFDPGQEEQQYIKGSPTRALDIQHQFSAYLFIDNDPERIARLEELKEKYGSRRRIRIREGDANDILLERLVQNPEIDWRRTRAVVFLDPFGMHVPWKTLEQLASTSAIEVFINLPVGTTIQRLLQTQGKITANRRQLLTSFFGTDQWEKVIYRDRDTLFGSETEKIDNSGQHLARWYAERLAKLFGYSSSPYLIRNERGTHLYYLIFAGPNKTGAKIAKNILEQGERIG